MRTLILGLLITSLAFVLCNSSKAVDESLVLYFSFDEGKGNNVKDDSSAGNNGTLQGKAEWVDGKSGKAMRFDGNGFVEVPHNENLNVLKNRGHTVSYWLKWDGQGASWSPFIAKTSGGGPTEDNFHTWVGADQVWDYENQPNGQTHAVTKIPLDNNWIHLTVTHDGKQTVSFYINGEEDKATNELKTTVGNDVNVHVGDDGKGNKGAGAIDELVIFSRPLTAEEIKILYEEGVEPFLGIAPTGKLATTWSLLKSQ
ncbi:TPA: LamG domain-containing protein [Candidatus Poribacteria bacterium]|nr:LamG domain-containing protein [Candidatus Poribacteria bacterium]